MTVIAIDARRKRVSEKYVVCVGGKLVRKCVAAYALWNGGPGYVVYHPEDISGNVYRTPDCRLSEAIRFGMVRVNRQSEQI
jgi:hypothetical protein